MSLFTLNALWEHQPAPNVAPGDPSDAKVPADGWLGPDPAPFGTKGSFATPYRILTPWAPNTGIWLRRNVELDGTRPLVLRGSVKNAALVYFDEQYIGAANPTNVGGAGVPQFTIVVPASLATKGFHEIAVLCLAGVGNYAYTYLEADYLRGFFPYPPERVRERLEWLTDVLEADDGSEERLRLRDRPRQSFTFDLPVSNREYARAFNIAYGSIPDQWFVPVWTEARRLGAVASGAFKIDTPTNIYDFRGQSHALLWESPRKWQLVGTTTVGAGSIGLSQPTEGFANAWVMPVRLGHLTGNVNRQTGGHEATWALTFTIDDNVSLASPDPDQFLGEDLQFLEGLLSGDSVTDNLIQRVEVTDLSLGTVAYRSPWANPRLSRPYRVVLANAAEVWAHRLWLHRRGGRYKAFWSPSLDADLRLRSVGTIAAELVVDSDDRQAYASDRTHIAVQTRDGAWAVRTVLGAEAIDSERTQLKLDSALNVSAADVLRVSYLGLRRLETDKVEFNWLGGGACQVEVRLVEIAP